MRKVLQQDDCAPDSMETFSTEFTSVTGMSVKDFKAYATREDFDMGWEWTIGDQVLGWFGDDPFYKFKYEIEEVGFSDLASYEGNTTKDLLYCLKFKKRNTPYKEERQFYTELIEKLDKLLLLEGE